MDAESGKQKEPLVFLFSNRKTQTVPEAVPNELQRVSAAGTKVVTRE